MVSGFSRKTTDNLCMKMDLYKAYGKIKGIHIPCIFMHGFSENFAHMIYECIYYDICLLPISQS